MFPALASNVIPPLAPVASMVTASAEDFCPVNTTLSVADKSMSLAASIFTPPVESISIAVAPVPTELILTVELAPPVADNLTALATLVVPVSVTLLASTVTALVASISIPPAELISTAEVPVPAEVISKVVLASVVKAFNLTAPVEAPLPIIVTLSLLEVILTALEVPEASIATVPAEFISTPAEPASICTPAPVESASITTEPVPVVTSLTPPFVPVATNFPPSASSEIWMLPVSKPVLAQTNPVPSEILNASVNEAGEPSLTAITKSPAFW